VRAIKVSEFKARCWAIVEQVGRTGEPVTILKRGQAVARLVPAAGGERYPQDGLAGSVEIVGDVVSPVLPERDWEALRPAPRRPRRCSLPSTTLSALALHPVCGVNWRPPIYRRTE